MKIDSQEEFAVWLGTPKGALQQPRGVGVVGGGREIQEGGNILLTWLIHADNRNQTNIVKQSPIKYT